ncbi:MAG: hypothetical protein J07HQW2_02087 [Haloquadratum walsbyi J07HQW2]|jgi:hypothetical protein|uniref:Uncharacterized protein n=2 Tax=Haloquadratum walsbyi TaxID=293091 RepID=U1NFM9_9EURY|nr:MAG: hypothetical protein J07HQW2_02087 [Haloquadratum walsbyi J07HQW2]
MIAPVQLDVCAAYLISTLQVTTSPLRIAGTVASFALFLTVTGHIAARNVLGDVPIRNAFIIGAVPALVAILVTTFNLNSFIGLAVAVILDWAVIRTLYEQSSSMSAYITFIHFVVSIILAAVLYAVLALIGSFPG